jgi:hypothetical protein
MELCGHFTCIRSNATFSMICVVKDPKHLAMDTTDGQVQFCSFMDKCNFALTWLKEMYKSWWISSFSENPQCRKVSFSSWAETKKSHSIFFPKIGMSSRGHTASITFSKNIRKRCEITAERQPPPLSLSLSLSLSHTHTHTHTHTYILSLSLSLSLTHTHTHTRSFMLRLSHTHT